MEEKTIETESKPVYFVDVGNPYTARNPYQKEVVVIVRRYDRLITLEPENMMKGMFFELANSHKKYPRSKEVNIDLGWQGREGDHHIRLYANGNPLVVMTFKKARASFQESTVKSQYLSKWKKTCRKQTL